MTKDEKQQKLLECKATAYDSIVKLRATIDSHRNFYRLVDNVISGVIDFRHQLAIAPTTASEQFPCLCADPKCPHCYGKCLRAATSQLYRIDMQDDSGTPMCDLCANDALRSGLFNIIEESCPISGQD